MSPCEACGRCEACTACEVCQACASCEACERCHPNYANHHSYEDAKSVFRIPDIVFAILFSIEFVFVCTSFAGRMLAALSFHAGKFLTALRRRISDALADTYADPVVVTANGRFRLLTKLIYYPRICALLKRGYTLIDSAVVFTGWLLVGFLNTQNSWSNVVCTQVPIFQLLKMHRPVLC